MPGKRCRPLMLSTGENCMVLRIWHISGKCNDRFGNALARLCTNLVKSVRVTGRLHQALQIDPRDFYPLGIGR